ncbi:MAG: elongation factor P maturation arginine rhamnosyltransferase EarP, partial [Azonexus sp.]|nr:elongation factor P maturation arginine rhamnosyltransferase EarP [Azonexus sp.]
MHQDWDIFCRVIDNYGDIGVCWRLARQLVREHGKTVRLWVDDLPSLSAICPEARPDQAYQQVAGVEIRHWGPTFVAEHTASVVVEAFACELPPAYIQAMAKRETRPCWINLEYLTAEPWAEGYHGMASPHPSLPLVKHFFFPGFSRSTGGLLHESSVLPASLTPANDVLTFSLFCYETAPVAELLTGLGKMPLPVRCLVTPGKPLAAVQSLLGGDGPWQIGLARIEPVPFRPMDDYDALLRQCDFNFVRGEDSFVRGQLAGKPMIWQIYPQDEDVHLIKLDAFL